MTKPTDRHAPPPLPENEPEDAPAFSLRRKRDSGEMDMTPMVDVVFLLLIFFMITTAFGLQKSVEIPAPDADAGSQQASAPQDREKTEENIVVQVTAENKILVEGEEAGTPQELYAKLRDRQHQGNRKNSHLLVMADAAAMHEFVIQVLDAAAGTGMDSVRLMTIDAKE